MNLRATCLLVLLTLASACGRDEAPAPEPTEAAATASGEAAKPAQRAPHPVTEEGLVEAVAAAIGARDLEALQRTAAPELAADLRRLHDEDTAGFWRRGSRWVEDVRSGVTISHRQDDSGVRWNVLVEFGNGHEERVTFTRVDGRLLLDQL